MNDNFLLRMKDVLLCLSAASDYDISLGRLEMQKIIYLLDSMSAYLFILSVKKGHQTYFYGPYDKNIQNAIDALVLRDIIKSQDCKRSKNSISCNYLLSLEGQDFVKNLISTSYSIKYRSRIANGILYSLVKRNLLSKVKQLVYAEPMFAESKEHGFYYDLEFSCENSGHNYLALIEHYIKGDKSAIDIPFTTDMYIDYLNTREKMLSSDLSKGDDSDAIDY